MPEPPRDEMELFGEALVELLGRIQTLERARASDARKIDRCERLIREMSRDSTGGSA